MSKDSYTENVRCLYEYVCEEVYYMWFEKYCQVKVDIGGDITMDVLTMFTFFVTNHTKKFTSCRSSIISRRVVHTYSYMI